MRLIYGYTISVTIENIDEYSIENRVIFDKK